MSVSKKLTLGFIIVLVLAAAVSIIGIFGMRSLRESGRHMYEKRVAGLSYVTSARSAYNKARVSGRILVMCSFFDDKKGALDAAEEYAKHIEEFRYWMEKSHAIADTDDLVEFHDRIQNLVENYYLPVSHTINENSINDIPEHKNRLYMNAEMAYLATITEKIDSYMNGLVDLNDTLAKQTDIDNEWIARIYVSLQAILLLVAVISAVVISRAIVKGITMPINEASEVLGAIASGDFYKQVIGNYKGEFETIKNAVNYTAIQLAVYVEETVAAQNALNETEIEKARVEAASEAMFAGINYASYIQRSILTPNSVFDNAFKDYSIIWEPRDIVGGDIYWLKSFRYGSLLCVCDCTGHGTSGALLTMLVASIFDSIVDETTCADTAQVVYMLDRRLSEALNVKGKEEGGSSIKDGCDIAALFISADGSVTLSSGHTHVFVCNGDNVRTIKGQNLFIGEGSLPDKEAVNVITIPANRDNKFYIASDGLFDQVGGEKGLPFGYRRFQQLILENHNNPHALISERIWNTFEEYRGAQERLDDVELISFDFIEQDFLSDARR